MATDQNRLQREKEYHNKAFSEGTRKKADKYYTIHKISFGQLIHQLKELCSGKDVLEYGCGPGSQSFTLSETAQTVTAIDISDFAIEQARKKAKTEGYDNLKFIEMNAEALQFNNNSFDIVYGNAIIHHLDLHKAFEEIKRVLKPGGKAFFYEPLGHNFIINLYRKLTPDMRTIDEKPLKHQDLKLLKKYFPNSLIKYLHFTSLLAVPFRNYKNYYGILKMFHKVDNYLFKMFPFMRRYAWYCVIEINND